MMRNRDRHPAGEAAAARRATATGAALLLVAALGCSDSPTGPVDPLFARYVAIGNSITAGFQSGGIDDESQRESYPAILARQAGARYAYASLGAGCPPPVSSLTDAVASGAPGGCPVSGAPGRKRLNNVAVPGADSFDPTALVPDPDRLTSLILDGKNQVDKALEETPSLVTVWIGNNDVLQGAIEGRLTSGLPTPKAVFVENYARMVNRLVAAGVDNGILIGVADVTRIPLLIPPSAFQDPTFRFVVNAAVGQTVTVLASCTESAGTLISLAIIPAMIDRTHGTTIDCAPGADFVLDPGEQSALTTAVAEYNSYISAKADSVGFAYLDPNPMWAAARANGSIPVIPQVANPVAPFGALFSLDGVHPARAGHVMIANALIDLIAAEFGVRVPRSGG